MRNKGNRCGIGTGVTEGTGVFVSTDVDTCTGVESDSGVAALQAVSRNAARTSEENRGRIMILKVHR